MAGLSQISDAGEPEHQPECELKSGVDNSDGFQKGEPKKMLELTTTGIGMTLFLAGSWTSRHAWLMELSVQCEGNVMYGCS